MATEIFVSRIDQPLRKVAIITGGASGIGRALSQELARRDVAVVVADKDAQAAQALAVHIEEAGGHVKWTAVDVTNAGEAQKLVQDTLKREGRIDFMFNNAGVAPSGDFRDMSLDAWRKIVDVNLNAAIYGSAAVYPAMIRQGAGHIVNTASLAGLIPAPGMALYTATKYAVVGFSTALRAEAGAFGVRVSVACPAFVRTNIRRTTAALLGAEAIDPTHDRLIVRIDPMDCARSILKGVERNKAIIVVPFYAGLAWRLYRLFPALFVNVFNPMIARKAR